MCTNRALVDSMECYMEDLLDNFEDFVKKSIIVVAVAVGFLVAMIAYVLKTVTERTQPSPVTEAIGSDTPSRRRSSQIQSGSNSSLNNPKGKVRKRKLTQENYLLFDCQGEKGTSTMCTKLEKDISCDEKVLKDIGYSGCQRPGCGLASRISKTSFRASIPSLPTECKKSGSSPALDEPSAESDEKLESCCSMCCDDKCERRARVFD